MSDPCSNGSGSNRQDDVDNDDVTTRMMTHTVAPSTTKLQRIQTTTGTTRTTGTCTNNASSVSVSSRGSFQPKVILTTSSLILKPTTTATTTNTTTMTTVTPTTSYVFQTSPSASFVPVHVVTPPTHSDINDDDNGTTGSSSCSHNDDTSKNKNHQYHPNNNNHHNHPHMWNKTLPIHDPSLPQPQPPHNLNVLPPPPPYYHDLQQQQQHQQQQQYPYHHSSVVTVPPPPPLPPATAAAQNLHSYSSMTHPFYNHDHYLHNYYYRSTSSSASASSTSLSSSLSPFSLQQPQIQHQYLVVTLQQRSDIHRGPWGLTVSYRNGIILIGQVNNNDSNSTNNNTPMVEGTEPSQSASSSPTPHVGVSDYSMTTSWVSPTQFFYTPKSTTTPPGTKTYQQYQDRFWFRNHLLQQQQQQQQQQPSSSPPQPSQTTPSKESLIPTDAIIQPGDCIVQIIPSDTVSSLSSSSTNEPTTTSSPSVTSNQGIRNNTAGGKILQYQQWDSLPSFIHTLRQSTNSVQLVLYRHPYAHAAMTAAKRNNSSGANTETRAEISPQTDSSTTLSNFVPHTRPTMHPYDATNTAFHVISTSFPILQRKENNNSTSHDNKESPSSSTVKRKLFTSTATNIGCAVSTKKFKSHCSTTRTKIPVAAMMNPLFDDPISGAKGIPFDDDNHEHITFSYYDDNDSTFVLPPVPTDIATWISERKQRWREQYRVYQIASSNDESVSHGEKLYKHQSKSGSRKRRINGTDDESDHDTDTWNKDFWTEQGFTSLEHWLRVRKVQWSKTYSWNQQKRQVLEQDLLGSPDMELLPLTYQCHCTDSSSVVTAIPQPIWDRWLRIRKTQWKVWRRKRQRRSQVSIALKDSNGATKTADESVMNEDNASSTNCDQGAKHAGVDVRSSPIPQNTELMVIDAILEEQERRERETRKERRLPFDISFIFDSAVGCPDDIVAKIFHYLPVLEHFKFICINHTTRNQIKQRHAMWKQLLPSHWTIPRRPRKSWQEFYTANVRVETERTRKLWDDLLSKASTILMNGDQLQAMEKLINEAQRGGRHKPVKGYDINYASGVVCERNSILNLAVIHQRQKVVRWLVEVKHADIESMDRGNFTPLLNAAWAGNKALVRFLLQKGADRSKLGRFHYTKPVAPIDFEGLTAEGWAEKKGYSEVARLLRLGL